MAVEMVPVQSSHVRAIGFDKEEPTLYVRFDNGTYAYDGVDEATYRAFLGAESKGIFLEQQIKGQYSYSRV